MIGQDILDQVRALIQPLQTRLANAAARAVISNVDASGKRQILQLIVLDGEEVDDCEHMQNYGFASRPITGAEAVVIFPNGDRGHPLVVAVEDKRYHPDGLETGECAMYNNASAWVRLREDGIVEAGNRGGAFQALATKADLDALADYVSGHSHKTTATVGASTTEFGIIASPGKTPNAVGTTKFVAE